jgi:hypothetical protein
MKRTYGVNDLLAAFWGGEVSQTGPIGSSIGGTYFFHGTGCRFVVGDKPIEVEFLPGGDELGFDAWRLWCFGTKYLGLPDLELDSIQGELSSACCQGALVLKERLYFVPGGQSLEASP